MSIKLLRATSGSGQGSRHPRRAVPEGFPGPGITPGWRVPEGFAGLGITPGGRSRTTPLTAHAADGVVHELLALRYSDTGPLDGVRPVPL